MRSIQNKLEDIPFIGEQKRLSLTETVHLPEQVYLFTVLRLDHVVVNSDFKRLKAFEMKTSIQMIQTIALIS